MAKTGGIPGPGEERIDAVYLWVDGADPAFQRRFAVYSGAAQPAEAAGSLRFRDNSDLRYSLRSVESFAPWVSVIHIVTAGQIPTWLNVSHERIHPVDHREIFPDESCLPTFNSCAIEINLHRIPGLSRRFLYLNDDLYLGRETWRSDFILPDGSQRFYVGHTVINRHFARGPVHDRAYLHTCKLLDRLWRGRRRDASSPAYCGNRRDRLLHRAPRRRLPAHTPQIYDREILAALEALLPDHFQATRAHRFRDANDLVLRLLYLYSLLESDRFPAALSPVLLDWQTDAYFFLMLEDSPRRISEKLAAINRLRPKFICINDDLDTEDADHPVLRDHRHLLQTLFPHPAAWEKSDQAAAGERSLVLNDRPEPPEAR
jgi:hypothetical protein